MMRLIAFVIYDGFQILDATGPLAAFEIAGRYVPGAYDLRIVAPSPGTVASSSGARMVAEPLSQAMQAHTLVVAGGQGSREAAEIANLRDLVIARAGRGARVTSVCSGAYVLAAAGLLAGRRATTHWSLSADFARRFARVRLEADRIWIKDGNIWTSAGITAGIDLALAMIAEDLGQEIARKTARLLVVYHRRPGGQSQFSVLSEIDPAGGRFSDLLEWAQEHLSGALSIEKLAERCAMSPRNFARAFTRDTGVTPAKAVERLRLEAARLRVEETRDSLETVAREIGFGDPERMRRAFVRGFGHPPQALRRRAIA